jgi:hypothetical protein
MDLPNLEISTSALTKRNRRLHARHTAQVQIEIHQEGNDVPMRLATTDLSRGGCYVEMRMPMPIGTHVQATLWLGACPIIIRGLVVTCHSQFGNGIRFEKFEGQSAQLLREYLDTITI